MKRQYPFHRAVEMAVGDRVIADSPSPLAAIKHGFTYEVAEISRSDAKGYVRVRGDDGWYRPYLFRRPAIASRGGTASPKSDSDGGH